MGLPKLNTPTYELVLPSTEEKIKYRPFLVKEQKLLLLAQESENKKDMLDAISQIIESAFNNCFLSLLSCAISKSFCSFTRNGLYLIVSSVEGNTNSYVGVSNFGNPIILSSFN